MKGMSLLPFIAVLLGCAEPQTPRPLPATEDYILTLRAMMNLRGCRDAAGPRSPAAEMRRREERILDAEAELKKVEAFARAAGFEDDLATGKVDFENRIEEELHVPCYPDEETAYKEARDAIANFGARLTALTQRD